MTATTQNVQMVQCDENAHRLMSVHVGLIDHGTSAGLAEFVVDSHQEWILMAFVEGCTRVQIVDFVIGKIHEDAY